MERGTAAGHDPHVMVSFEVCLFNCPNFEIMAYRNPGIALYKRSVMVFFSINIHTLSLSHTTPHTHTSHTLSHTHTHTHTGTTANYEKGSSPHTPPKNWSPTGHLAGGGQHCHGNYQKKVTTLFIMEVMCL